MPRLPERLPAALSERLASAAQSIYSSQGREVDVAIGGIPFMLANYPENPATVETVPVRKDQFDTERDPGEQSLTSWWRRSQSSFHEGAGLIYQEDNEGNPSFGFHDSEGVWCFTKGELSLLRKMEQKSPIGTLYSRCRSYYSNSTRTNLSSNPGFEVDTTGWTTSAGGGPPSDLPTLTRDTTKFETGVASGKVTWNTDDSVSFPPFITLPSDSIAAGTVYTCTIRVWVPSGYVGGFFLIADGVFGDGIPAARDQWATMKITATAGSAGGNRVSIWNAGSSVGQFFYIDSMLFETGTVTGAYFDGSSPNATWNGTAGKSSSVETISASAPSLSAVGSGALYTAATYSSNYASLHAPVGKTIVDGLISGGQFYDIASDGTLYGGSVSSPGTATTWPLGSTPSRIGWGKYRLWVIGGQRLWQPDLSLAGGVSQSPIFTHPSSGWNYTCMAETPGVMLFGGHDGSSSAVQAVSLDSSGALPTLSGATVVLTLPNGELIQELACLAGTFVGIGTNLGFRVGVIDSSSGTITYGPLMIEPEGVLACTSLTTQSRFFVVGFRTTDGRSLAYRVDTSTQIEDGVFAWAKDIDCGVTGPITSIAAVDSTTLACTTQSGQDFRQSLTQYVDSAYLLGARIRFRTTELKSFKFLNLELEPLHGTVAASLIQEGEGTLPLGTISTQGEVFSDSFAIQMDPMRYASVRLDFAPGSSGTTTPVLNSYLLRALPAVGPQRMITLPLLCFDREQSKSGQAYGGMGYSHDRLTALQLLEDAAETVILQDFSQSSATGQIVTIESMRFIQNTPARPNRSDETGGILIVQLRTVA